MLREGREKKKKANHGLFFLLLLCCIKYDSLTYHTLRASGDEVGQLAGGRVFDPNSRLPTGWVDGNIL